MRFSTSLLAAWTALHLKSILVAGHASIWHPSMYGFNVTQQTFNYDNRPVAPLTNYTFDQWWFHGHLDHPPNPGDIFDLPAGGTATTEIACNKGATTYFASSEGGDIRNPDKPNDPCPGSQSSEYHTTGFDDLKGCALAIAYKNDARAVNPEDFTVFSINQTCVWNRFTDFQVPARMPPCPEGGCTCAWFWIHSQDSGGEQNYMNGFKCNITSPTSTVALAKPVVPRRCGADPPNKVMADTPGNCTYGAKQPFYWFQAENNNMFEGTYSPPFYLDLYNFRDGPQDDIFADSYPQGLPTPSVNQKLVPTPFLGGAASASNETSSSTTSTSVASLSSTSATAGVAGTTTIVTFTATATATLMQTVFVTVSPSPSSFSASTTTSTLVQTVVVTLPASVAATSSSFPSHSTSLAQSLTTSLSAASSPAPSLSTTTPATSFAPPLASAAASALNLTAIPVLNANAALFADSDVPAPTSGIPSPNTNAQCYISSKRKRDVRTSKRQPSQLSSWHVTGAKARRLTRRENLWRIF